MNRGVVVGVVSILAACGSNSAPPSQDAEVRDATTNGLDAPPTISCGCPTNPDGGSCVSLNVFEWVSRTPVGPSDGLTVYVVDEDNYDERTTVLGTGVPDSTGRVVVEFAATPDRKTFVILDDDDDATEDLWSHAGFGSIAVPGNAECIDAPALSKSHGDTIFLDSGYDPNGGTILVGTVILEVRDQDGELRELIGLDSTPFASEYFTDDRQHLDRYLTSTTSSGAVFTGAAYVCSPLCRNMNCECTEFPCGILAAERGGTGKGFFFSSVECHR